MQKFSNSLIGLCFLVSIFRIHYHSNKKLCTISKNIQYLTMINLACWKVTLFIHTNSSWIFFNILYIICMTEKNCWLSVLNSMDNFAVYYFSCDMNLHLYSVLLIVKSIMYLLIFACLQKVSNKWNEVEKGRDITWKYMEKHALELFTTFFSLSRITSPCPVSSVLPF